MSDHVNTLQPVDGWVPIAIGIQGYNGSRIIHEIRDVYYLETSTVDEGGLSGIARVSFLMRFYVIPRRGGVDRVMFVDHRSEVVSMPVDRLWGALSRGWGGLLALEGDYPTLTLRTALDDHPGLILAAELERTAPERYEWAVSTDPGPRGGDPAMYVVEENMINDTQRLLTVPITGGWDSRTLEVI